MTEYYFNEVIVLDREPANEIDNRFSVYAKGFGKIVARGKSTRKITSKLSGHLEPGNLVRARFIEKNGLQVVDALKSLKIKIPPADLHFLNRLLPEGDFDFQIWKILLGARELSWREMLVILGWDPEHATCEMCGNSKVVKFAVENQVFACSDCGFSLVEFVPLD